MATVKEQPVPGFKSFWERSKRIAACQNLTFVQVEIDDPNEPKKSKKNAKPVRKESSDTISRSGRSESPLPENRRKQVYQAQRRHRQRKTEYAQSLEEEIAHLERMQADADSEARRFTKENQYFKCLLHSRGIRVEAKDLERRSSAMSAGGAAQSPDGNATTTPKSSDMLSRQAPRLSKRKRDPRLRRLLEVSDPEMDSSSRDLIEKSQKLLLRDVKPFQSDETEEKRSWERLADLVLDSG